MEALLLEQHLRAPLRLFPDPLLAQFATAPGQEMDGAHAALLEKARQHLQIWGRSPYNDLLLPQMYQRPPQMNLGNFWQSQPWPQQLPPAAFLQSAAAAAAASAAVSQASTPPPSHTTVSTSSSSSGSPSPSDMRAKHFGNRFSPYQMPPQHVPPQHNQPPSPRSPLN